MPEGAAKQRFYKDNKGSVLEGDRLTRTAAK
jgi:hypothetical protein